MHAVAERFPIEGEFRISRGAKTEAVVVVATVRDGELLGRGEAVPYPRYGESVESVVAAIEGVTDEATIDALPAGAARNALDCARWDLEAQRTGRAVHELLGLPEPASIPASRTLSGADPQAMARAAVAAGTPTLKLKLLGDGRDVDRVREVRAAVPEATLVADANEGLAAATLEAELTELAGFGVALVEQPLPAGADSVLATFAHPMPICADESVHDRATLPSLVGRYDAVNVKLDKTGGLTEAFRTVDAARALGLGVMVGCMACTSLSIAPAWLLAPGADWLDLDGPTLLARDRDGGMQRRGAVLVPPSPALWGHRRG